MNVKFLPANQMPTNALGYSDGKHAYVRNDMPNRLTKMVAAHEREHVAKGERGNFAWAPVVASIAGSLISGSMASRAADRSADAARDAAQVQLQMHETQREDLAPWRAAGQEALLAQSDLLGLGYRDQYLADLDRQIAAFSDGAPASSPATLSTPVTKPFNLLDPFGFDSAPADNNTASVQAASGSSAELARLKALRDAASTPYDFRATPGYDFRLSEGQKALEQSAAARGQLLSGQQVKAGLQYGQNMAESEYGNVYNRLAGLSGTGQTATQSLIPAGTTTAANVGTAYQNAGIARASGYAGVNNALQQGISNSLYWWMQQPQTTQAPQQSVTPTTPVWGY